MRNRLTFMIVALVVVAVGLAATGFQKETPWAEKVTARVDGLACPFCAYGVEKKLERLEGVDSLEVRINEGLVILYSKDNGRIDEKMINRKIEEGGFTPRGVKRQTLRPSSFDRKPEVLEKIQLKVQGMRCEYCVLNIESALGKIEGVRTVSVDLDRDRVDLSVDGRKVSPDSLIRTIESIGAFDASVDR